MKVEPEIAATKERGFFASLLIGIARDLMKFVLAFIVGTSAAA